MVEMIDDSEMTFPKLLRENARKCAKEICMRKKDFGIWREYCWEETYEKVCHFGLGLMALGFKERDKMAILGDNDPEWCWGQLGAQAVGGIVTGIFSDATPEEIGYIIDHSEATVVLANDQEQVDKVLKIKNSLPRINRIIYWDRKGLTNYSNPLLIFYQDLIEIGKERAKESPELIEEYIDRGKGEDVCLLLYTSGTTGNPKGVMISHKGLIQSTRSMLQVFKVKKGDSLFSAFPAAWMGEQLFTISNFLLSMAAICYPEEPESAQEDLREISPAMVVLGPRQWEAICSSIQVKMKDADVLKRFIYLLFLPVSKKRARCFLEKRPVPLSLKIGDFFARKVVFDHLKDKLGMRKTKIFITGSASLSPDIFEFLHAVGLKLRQAYAGTEAGFAFGHTEDDVKSESVGRPVPGIKVKISDNQELLIGGETIFTGYYKNQEETDKALKDGWFHTGDACNFTDEGHLIYIDRVSELGKLSTGAGYSPQYIEGRLRFSPYIKDALILGNENHPCICGIIVIDFEMVGKWAEDNGINYTTFVDLSQKSVVAELVLDDIKRVNNLLPETTRIKRYVLLHKEFDPDEGELTRTRKIKRKVMYKKYNELIDAIYSGKPSVDVVAEVKYRDGRLGKIKTELRIRDVE